MVLFTADLKLPQAITFEDLKVNFATVSGSGLKETFSNFKLLVGNTVVSTFQPNSFNGSFIFDTTFTV